MEDNNLARIIDTKSLISSMETTEKLSRLKQSKKLNKIANLEIDNEFDKKKNPFENMRIPRSAMRKKSTKRKKTIMDFEKLTVNEYTYDEFSKSVNTVLPNMINHFSFHDEEFLKKLKASKDIKHFCAEEIMFPITNNYLGFTAAVLGCAIEYYSEHKLGKPPPPIQPVELTP